MKQIDVYIKNKNVLLDTYNENYVSQNLVNYILDKAIHVRDYDDLNLCLYVTEETKGCSNMIKDALKDEHKRNIRKTEIINIKQIVLLFLGLCLLLLTTLVDDSSIINEIILIIGWVPIWEAAELELFTDVKDRRKRRILKKLMQCDIKEVEIDKD